MEGEDTLLLIADLTNLIIQGITITIIGDPTTTTIITKGVGIASFVTNRDILQKIVLSAINNSQQIKGITIITNG